MLPASGLAGLIFSRWNYLLLRWALAAGFIYASAVQPLDPDAWE